MLLTVTAGSTAAVTFKNILKAGRISIMKINTQGNPLSGAEFLLEWSSDGVNWEPVVYTGSEYVSAGTCSSVGLTNGRLVSNADGKAVFTGLHPEMQYRLTETSAPEGYQRLAEPAYTGGLSTETELEVKLTVVNAPTYMLPMTGSNSLVLAPFAAFLSAAAGAVIVLITGKGKKRV